MHIYLPYTRITTMSTRRKKRTYSFVAYGYLGGKVTPEEHAEQQFQMKQGAYQQKVSFFLFFKLINNYI